MQFPCRHDDVRRRCNKWTKMRGFRL